MSYEFAVFDSTFKIAPEEGVEMLGMVTPALPPELYVPVAALVTVNCVDDALAMVTLVRL